MISTQVLHQLISFFSTGLFRISKQPIRATSALWKLQRLRNSPRFSEADGDPGERRKLQREELHVTGNNPSPEGSTDGEKRRGCKNTTSLVYEFS